MPKNKILKGAKRIVESILIVLSLIFFLAVLLPIISFLFVLLYAWRLCLIGYVKLFRRDIIKIMGGRNPVLAVDDIHGHPLNTIVGMGAFDNATAEDCKQYVMNSVYAMEPATGQFVNPTLRQYYKEWIGYIWWCWEEDFHIDDHFTIWNTGDEEVSEEEFIKIIGILESSPYNRGKSPWEAVIVRNVRMRGVRDEHKLKTNLVFRFHHGLADGVALLQVFMRCVFADKFELQQPAYKERSSRQLYCHHLLAALQLPYQFFKQSLSALDFNEWHLPSDKLTRKIHKAWSKRIPIEDIKKYKRDANVGFTAVLTAVITTALRKMMIKYKGAVPRNMHAIAPLPWPNHPQKLCNYWSYGFLELPVGIEDGRKRLVKSQRFIHKMKKSPVPVINFAILGFFNLLPTWLIRTFMVSNKFPTVVLSNFPGPPECSGFGFKPLADAMFTGGPLQGNIGISITILSCIGHLRIVTGVDSAIFPRPEMAKEFINLIETEFSLLGDSKPVGLV